MTLSHARSIRLAMAICLAVALGHAAHTVSARQSDETNSRPGSTTVKFADGQLTGTFRHRPLGEVLEAIGRQADFEYQGSQEALGYAVSAAFEDVPLSAALTRLLTGFNHVVILDKDGGVGRLIIGSPRGPSPEPGAAAARASRSSPVEIAPAILPPELEMTSEQYFLFERALASQHRTAPADDPVEFLAPREMDPGLDPQAAVPDLKRE